MEEYAVRRDVGLSPVDAAAAAGIPAGRAARYEQAISLLIAALKTETAPGAMGAVPTHTPRDEES